MENISPFNILGIEEKDYSTNRYEIACAYRSMLLLYHPDKNNCNLPKDEKCEATIRIREAYKTIMNDYIFTDCPDYDIIYSFEENDEIITTPKLYNFNVDEFNKNFENEKIKDIRLGMTDPYNEGYTTFDRKNEKEMYLERNYNNNYIPQKEQIPPSVLKSLINHKPEEITENNNNYEFGLLKIDNFTINSKPKSKNVSLKCQDLQQVYDNYTPNWEKIASLDPQLNSRFKTKDSVNIKLDKMLNHRKIKVTPISLTPKTSTKQKIQSMRDDYFSKKQRLIS